MLITPEDLAAIVADVGLDALMDESIEEFENALHDGDLDVRRRDGFATGRDGAAEGAAGGAGMLEWMPAARRGDTVALKVVGYQPANPRARGLPTVLATSTLYDCRSGALTAIMDATFTTALRTGAASAVATRHLADDGSKVLGVVGCGAQAVTQVHALSRVLPLSRVLAYDRDPRVAWSFPGRVAFTGLPVDVVDLDELERRSEVLCTATSVPPGAGPVLTGLELAPAAHINAIGSDLPGKAELPAGLLARAVVCPDFLPQALVEGECQRLAPDRVGPSLAEVVAGGLGDSLRGLLTVFDSTGYAVQDLVVAETVLRHARRIGVGSPLPTFTGAIDPLDPYCLVRRATSAVRAGAATR
jgi:ornithine cyclodeaminase/alanine dehydrogenase-like protein (mu-crystallin family)